MPATSHHCFTARSYSRLTSACLKPDLVIDSSLWLRNRRYLRRFRSRERHFRPDVETEPRRAGWERRRIPWRRKRRAATARAVTVNHAAESTSCSVGEAQVSILLYSVVAHFRHARRRQSISTLRRHFIRSHRLINRRWSPDISLPQNSASPRFAEPATRSARPESYIEFPISTTFHIPRSEPCEWF